MSISPSEPFSGSTAMNRSSSWKRPSRSTKSLLKKRQPRRYVELVGAEAQAAQRADLVADLVDVGREVDVRVAALEAVLDLRARKMMQHDLHHRELVEVGVEQRLDDHRAVARGGGRCGARGRGVGRCYPLAARQGQSRGTTSDSDAAAPRRRRRSRMRRASQMHSSVQPDGEPADDAVVRQRAVRRAADDESGDHRREPRAQLLDRAR